MKCVAIIPARYESKRLPGKPLHDINGKSMIQRVLEQTYKSKMVQTVIVATDDSRIADHVTKLGYSAVMTDADIGSGTERCFSAAEILNLDYEVLINVQGDEPFLEPANIDKLCEKMIYEEWPIGTLYTDFNEENEVKNPGNVKLVTNSRNEALYFSRSVIPSCPAGDNLNEFKRHVGMYAFDRKYVEEIGELKSCSLVDLERLEQLNWLYRGFTIGCEYVKELGMSVDTKEDLSNAILFAKKMNV